MRTPHDDLAYYVTIMQQATLIYITPPLSC